MKTNIEIKDESKEYAVEWLTFRDLPGWFTIGNWVEL